MLYTPFALPSRLDEVFNVLQRAGVRDAILYGGALRDADCGREIHDYDFLVGPTLGRDSVEDEVSFITRGQNEWDGLMDNLWPYVTEMPEPGRWLFTVDNLNLDMCFNARGISAFQRAQGTIVGLSAIAMDMTTREIHIDETYLMDRHDKTISLLRDVDGAAGIDYAEKIQKKYPKHAILDSRRFIVRPPVSVS